MDLLDRRGRGPRQGDVHPVGNPHMDLDPVRMAAVGQALAGRLGQLDPAGAASYRARAEAFAALVDARTATWQAQLAGAPGAVLYHRDAIYLLERLGVPLLGTIEPIPGVPPTGRQLSELTGALEGRRRHPLRPLPVAPGTPGTRAGPGLAGRPTAARAPGGRGRQGLPGPYRALGRGARECPMSRDPAAPPRALLRLEDLVAGYTAPVVGPVSFSIQAGEVLGLWGANGSGKSTLLNAIAEAARIFSGRIERAPGLTLDYQEQRPVRLPAMPLTGRDLLRCAGAVGDRRPPGSLGELLDRRLDRLSGGQFQLLSVWAALAGTADLVLLDEPTNNLDPEHERLLAAILSKPRVDGGERRAVLLVSHERAFLEDACTRVLEIAPGGATAVARSRRGCCA